MLEDLKKVYFLFNNFLFLFTYLFLLVLFLLLGKKGGKGGKAKKGGDDAQP